MSHAGDEGSDEADDETLDFVLTTALSMGCVDVTACIALGSQTPLLLVLLLVNEALLLLL